MPDELTINLIRKYFQRIQQLCVVLSFRGKESKREQTIFFEELINHCICFVKQALLCADATDEQIKIIQEFSNAFFLGYRSINPKDCWLEHPLVAEKVKVVLDETAQNPYENLQKLCLYNFNEPNAQLSIGEVKDIFEKLFVY